MKMKKVLAAVLTASVIAVSSMSGVNAEDRILLGGITASTAENVTTVSVELLSKPAGKSIALVAAYMTEDGKILSVNSTRYEDVSALEEDVLKVCVNDKSADGASLKYYIWDSVSGIKPLENNVPVNPLNVSAEAVLSKVNIGWDAAVDDYDDSSELKYNVYDDGMLIAENISTLNYSADKLAWGTEYNFEVSSVDSEGKESKISSVSAVTPMYSSVATTDVAQSSPDGQLEFTGTLTDNTKLHYCVTDRAGGLDCYATTTRHNGDDTYLCYRFSPSYLAKITDDREFWVEITYFDEGTEKIFLDIFGTGERGIVDKTNTNTWKTVRKKITTNQMTENTNDGNAFFNFRVTDKNDAGGLKIRNVSIMTTDEYTNLNKYAGAYLAVDASTVSCGLKSNMEGKTTEAVDGRNGIKLSSLENSECTFYVTETTVVSGSAVVEIIYYSQGASSISLNGNSQPIEETGKWRKIQFDVNNISTGENIITADGELYINSLRVKSRE